MEMIMTDIAQGGAARGAGLAPAESSPAGRLSVAAVGLSLSSFFALTYLICFLVELIVPEPAIQAWLRLFPGTLSINWLGLAQGLALSVIWGWYVALGFVPIYNSFTARFR